MNRTEPSPASLSASEITALQEIAALGYACVCHRGAAGICGLRQLFYTGALYVRLTRGLVLGRYCYRTFEEARQALLGWDGAGDPPGNWIKFKGRAGERHGPGWKCLLEDEESPR